MAMTPSEAGRALGALRRRVDPRALPKRRCDVCKAVIESKEQTFRLVWTSSTAGKSRQQFMFCLRCGTEIVAGVQVFQDAYSKIVILPQAQEEEQGDD